MSTSALRRFKWPLLIILGALLSYWMLKSYQSDLNTNLDVEARNATSAGASYGMQNDQQACIDKVLRDIQGCNSFACGVVHGRFIKACLQEAQPSNGFCTDVPPFTEKKDRDTNEWLRDICFEHPETNTCYLVRRQQQQLCSS